MGCRVCRARKVKCDGRPNGCRNCERLQLDCVGDDGASSATGSAAGHRRPSLAVSLRKIRTYRSCASCRLSKTKCNGDRPRCARCAAKRVECVYDGGAAPRWARSLDQSQSQSSSRGPDSDEADDHAPPRSKGRAGSGDENGSITVAKSQDGALSEVPAKRPRTSQVSRGDGTVTGTGTGTDGAPPTPSEPGAPADHLQAAKSPYTALNISPSDPLAWMLSPDLPSPRHLRRLVEHYFTNIHPIRCFAFVHKPSFMRQLDKGFTSDDELALLHIMCAQGAKFHALSQLDETPTPAFLRAVGNQWAKKAEFLILSNFGKISVQRLMTAVLLQDYHFRAGEYNQALILSGVTVRMAHALKINSEYSPDIMCAEPDGAAPSVVSRESRRRLMWACYVLDAWTSSGSDQLSLLRENDIKIQLPCNERNFGLRIASVTETLGVGHVLQFLPPAIVPRRPAANMGIMAYYIRIVTLWKKVVRYLSHTNSAPPPWSPESEFAALDADLKMWRRELPDFVEYSADTIYARLDSNQLGALVVIHCTYHYSYLELYKVAMPDLFKLRRPFAFPPEHAELLQSVQAECYHHAQRIAAILAEAAQHGARLLSDGLFPFFVYDSSRVILYYVSRLLDPGRADAHARMKEAVKAVESNNRLLGEMSPLYPIADSLSSTLEGWLSKIRRASDRAEGPNRSPVDSSSGLQDDLSSIPAETPTHTPEFVLPPISLHRLSRGSASERPPEMHRLPSVSGSEWSTANPNANSTWDHTSAAHQLVGLSQDGTAAAASRGLQHERPVSLHPLPKPAAGAGPGPSPAQPFVSMSDVLELEDLQNFLSWDMHGIMEVSDSVSNLGTEDTGLPSWSGGF